MGKTWVAFNQGGPLGPIFILSRTALKDPFGDPHYGIFSKSPARATFELLFRPRELRG